MQAVVVVCALLLLPAALAQSNCIAICDNTTTVFTFSALQSIAEREREGEGRRKEIGDRR